MKNRLGKRLETMSEAKNLHFNRLTETQRFYFYHLLTLRKPKWDEEAAAQAVIEAKVDLNPHQIEAATFAFRNPLAGGVILADEVGLGKTIETGLVLSQLWAEGKRAILVVAPKSLRHQWQDELRNLFGLESEIIDTKTARAAEKLGLEVIPNRNSVLITNEHFFNNYSSHIRAKRWDLIVIDEAHKLRNVWRNGKNQAQRAKLIRDAIRPFKKLLLTATPMQNNLMELFGLTSFIEDSILGTQESFQQTFQRIPEEEREERLSELKYRMQKFFHRELRRNVSDFIKYTKRNAVTFEFDPDDEEEQLRKDFESYLAREDIVGIPKMASHLLKLIYCKLLASSSFALRNSLLGIYKRFMVFAATMNDQKLFNLLHDQIDSTLRTSDGRKTLELEDFEKLLYKNVRPKSFDGLRTLIGGTEVDDLIESESEIEDNYAEDDLEAAFHSDIKQISTEHAKILDEAKEVLEFIQLTKKIRKNTKGDALKQALERQFSQAREQGWPEKAVIFTEFKTTQQYVINVLEQMGLSLDNDIVIFNGGVGDAESRRKLVLEFKEKKKIFLTTEAGAEGLNLQFCNLIINYDLPWNPQRIEQRIGRCHRYGQALDVVVVNFVNKKNHADRRVLELLGEKFHLFEGAFGVSDEVLGEIQSGNDIEKEILSIYLNCRTPEEIDKRFQEMLALNKDSVDEKLRIAKEKLLAEFDEDVQKRLRDVHDRTKQSIDAKQAIVRDCVLSSIPDDVLVGKDTSFSVSKSFQGLLAGIEYSFVKDTSADHEVIHISHPAFKEMNALQKVEGHLKFEITNKHKISMLVEHIGKRGSFQLHRIRIDGIESFDALVPLFIFEDGSVLDPEVAHKLLGATSRLVSAENLGVDLGIFDEPMSRELEKLHSQLKASSEVLYHEEIEKIEFFFEDLERQKKYEKDDLQKKIEELKKERRKLPLQAQASLNSEISKLKDKQLKLDEDIARIGRESREREKKLVASLESKLSMNSEPTLIGCGTFEIV